MIYIYQLGLSRDRYQSCVFQCGEERVCYDAGHIEAHDSGLGDSYRRDTGECKYSSSNDDDDG